MARCLALFASKRDSQAALLRAAAVNQMVLFARDKEDPGVARYGSLGIGNLAVQSQNHQELFDTGAVMSLLPLATSDDLETRRCVAFGLNNIATNEANHRVCERMGVLRPLVQLLKDPDVDVHLQACFAIRQLSLTPKCRFQFIELKGGWFVWVGLWDGL